MIKFSGCSILNHLKMFSALTWKTCLDKTTGNSEEEGPNFSYIVQVVEGDLGHIFNVLIKRECRIKSNT